MFKSIEDVQKKLLKEKYICDTKIATVVYLSAKIGKPILVEGQAGVGKTELGKVLASAYGLDLIRLQCYEGLDEAKALYEWEYSKQLLYTQILKDKIGETLRDTSTLKDAVDKIGNEDQVFFSQRFLVQRPLMKAITSHKPSVLLIDEIDRSDEEFEAFLLEVLSDFQISVPEIGTIKAKHIPLVILTSNNTRDLSDALKRRCLHLFVGFPEKKQELEIIKMKVENISDKLADQIVAFIQEVRKMDLKKLPGISETLDWARALTILNIDSIDKELANNTLNIILKYEDDVRKAQNELKSMLDTIKMKQEKVAVETKDIVH